MTQIVVYQDVAPPWPGSPGGAWRQAWGDSIRLFVQMGLASGLNFHMGPHPQAFLDAGNVMGHVNELIPGSLATPTTVKNWHIGPHALDKLSAGNTMGHLSEYEPGTGGLWTDIGCDVTSMVIADGSTSKDGIMSRDEASTVTFELFDPLRKYDPTNPTSPYWLGTRSRLQAGIRIRVFAEVLNEAGTGVYRYDLFGGTTDTWTAPIGKRGGDRTASVVATGAVKAYAAQDYLAATANVRGGDTTAQRLDHLRTYFNLYGQLEQHGVESTVTLQATTLAQSAWELLNRTIDDELGYLHVMPDGTLRWWTRNTWTTQPPGPKVTLGCHPDVPEAFDIITDAPSGADADTLRNAVYAARAGGTQQVVKNEASIDSHGGVEHAMTRTDLGLADDMQVAAWAQQIVGLFAFPEPGPVGVVLFPALDGETDGHIWRPILGTQIVSDAARIVWSPGDGTGDLDHTVRVLGVHHTIDPASWKVEWQLLPARLAVSNVWHIGPHQLDRLDHGNVMGWTTEGGT